jgi:catechol 2,3-dioxygenase-like lactoylglutathione lyase family enzyme
MPASITAVIPVLMARDVEESLAFFARLGFAETFRDQPVKPRYAGIRRESVVLHLQWGDPGQWEHHGDRPVYRFPTPDPDALYAELRAVGDVIPASGGGPFAVPKDSPWGTREFHLHDPAANVLQFYTLLPSRGPEAAG